MLRCHVLVKTPVDDDLMMRCRKISTGSFCMIHLLLSLFSFQAVPQRGIFAKRACVSTEVSVRTSGTPTPATVLMAAEARTVNKVSVCVHVVFHQVFLHLSLPLPLFFFDSQVDCQRKQAEKHLHR